MGDRLGRVAHVPGELIGVGRAGIAQRGHRPQPGPQPPGQQYCRDQIAAQHQAPGLVTSCRHAEPARLRPCSFSGSAILDQHLHSSQRTPRPARRSGVRRRVSQVAPGSLRRRTRVVTETTRSTWRRIYKPAPGRSRATDEVRYPSCSMISSDTARFAYTSWTSSEVLEHVDQPEDLAGAWSSSRSISYWPWQERRVGRLVVDAGVLQSGADRYEVGRLGDDLSKRLAVRSLTSSATASRTAQQHVVLGRGCLRPSRRR